MRIVPVSGRSTSSEDRGRSKLQGGSVYQSKSIAQRGCSGASPFFAAACEREWQVSGLKGGGIKSSVARKISRNLLY